MKVEPVLATIMFQQIENQSAQRAAIYAAIGHVNPTDVSLFITALGTTKASQDVRNTFAHHLWGTCSTINALLLVDPKHFALGSAKSSEEFAKARAARGMVSVGVSPIDYNNVCVYTEKDLIKEVSAADRASRIIGLLHALLGWPQNSHAYASIRRQLTSEPLIAEALSRRRS
jgi:hypothetical protein